MLDLGARRGCVVSTTPRQLYRRERPGTHCTGGWVGPRAGRDVCEKFRPHRDFFLFLFTIPGLSLNTDAYRFDPRTVQPVASRYTD
jgi:hypothetical protein